jgi:RNA polymerase sigma factor (sigma-70 family)
LIEPRRLADLFDTHAASLTLYARQIDAVDAEEHVQEAFVRLMAEAGAPANPAAWLALTVRRLAIDRKRSWFRRRRRERAVANTEPFEPTSDSQVDARHAAELLATLPERQREIVVLRIWHGLTIEAVAEVVGISKTTAHEGLTVALAALRKRMEPGRTENQCVT